MKKLINLKQLTNTQYLNFFDATYTSDGKSSYHYYFASRRNTKDLSVNNLNKEIVDAVRILPYFKKEGKIYIVLIKEFRHPINRYIYGTPAGCVEKGEEPLESAIREVEEEIGATVKNIQPAFPFAYADTGVTDEVIASYEAEVELNKEQKLDDIEEIELLTVELSEIPSFIEKHQFCIQSQTHLLMFYYKNFKV